MYGRFELDDGPLGSQIVEMACFRAPSFLARAISDQ
jgi:hypothetical protein